MKFILRDDDISYFTNPKQIEDVYNGIWDELPISCAVIPFIAGAHKTGAPNEQATSRYPIGKNKQLVKFLKEKIKQRKITIVLHGYAHRMYDSLFEYERDDVQLLTKELEEGKQYLENLFNIQIQCFVPPHDRMSKAAITALEKNNLNLCRGFAPLPRELHLRSSYLKNFFKLVPSLLTKNRYPGILDYTFHKELYSYRIEHLTPSKLVYLNKQPLVCVTCHHHDMDDKKISLLKSLLKKKTFTDLERVWDND